MPTTLFYLSKGHQLLGFSSRRTRRDCESCPAADTTELTADCIQNFLILRTGVFSVLIHSLNSERCSVMVSSSLSQNSSFTSSNYLSKSTVTSTLIASSTREQNLLSFSLSRKALQLNSKYSSYPLPFNSARRLVFSSSFFQCQVITIESLFSPINESFIDLKSLQLNAGISTLSLHSHEPHQL